MATIWSSALIAACASLDSLGETQYQFATEYLLLGAFGFAAEHRPLLIWGTGRRKYYATSPTTGIFTGCLVLHPGWWLPLVMGVGATLAVGARSQYLNRNSVARGAIAIASSGAAMAVSRLGIDGYFVGKSVYLGMLGGAAVFVVVRTLLTRWFIERPARRRRNCFARTKPVLCLADIGFILAGVAGAHLWLKSPLVALGFMILAGALILSRQDLFEVRTGELAAQMTMSLHSRDEPLPFVGASVAHHMIAGPEQKSTLVYLSPAAPRMYEIAEDELSAVSYITNEDAHISAQEIVLKPPGVYVTGKPGSRKLTISWAPLGEMRAVLELPISDHMAEDFAFHSTVGKAIYETVIPWTEDRGRSLSAAGLEVSNAARHLTALLEADPAPDPEHVLSQLHLLGSLVASALGHAPAGTPPNMTKNDEPFPLTINSEGKVT